ncbi:Predicted arabinose efflux permease, MFS family [Pseudomonas flavescens]|uniref:Predicted arabinose efflux permease, MFS family n=1 Tax=Phytopseudomonas flavescens TaxID=29435 RepID=A0A1G8EEN3_9GAMM|nr:MFS transporter [Pseudomonas flavescens]SDH68344.1 Predicted arabinose efflux permease, MFS family [Pseudomonas flavescens]
MTEDGKAQGLWLRLVLTAAMALPMLIFYAVGTLGPLMVADLDVPPHWLGWLIMSAFGLAALLSLWAGPLVNRLGTRRATAWLFWATVAAYGLLASLPGFAGVVLALAVCGIAQALANPVTNLLIAERVAPSDKASVVGLKQSGVQVSALFAGLLLPGLASGLGWRGALATLLVPALLLALLGPRVAPRTHQVKPVSLAVSRPNGRLALLMGVQLCVGIVLSSFVTFLGLFAARQGMTPGLIGGLIAGFGVMGIVARICLTPLGARMADESWLLLGLLLLSGLALWLTSMATTDSRWLLWAGALGMGLTAVATNAIAMSMVLRDPGFGHPAPAAGLLSVGFFAGFALGPVLFGHLLRGTWGFAEAWLALIGVLLLGCGLSLLLLRARQRHRCIVLGGQANPGGG